jgi:GntR family carbon starvation induced transcriptional regulator
MSNDIRALTEDSEGWGPKLRLIGEPPHKTLAERIFHEVRADIMSGSLNPGGKLKADELKLRYGVGTSPIREALFQLASEGLVKADGQRGFRVAPLCEAELRDITEWRETLECEALQRSIKVGDLEWETTAVAALHRLKQVAAQIGLDHAARADLWETRHRSYHFALYGACGSPWLLRFCELLLAQGERYRRSFLRYDRISPAITREHEDLLDAALARDADRAVEILRRHIRRATEIAGASLKGRDKRKKAPARDNAAS